MANKKETSKEGQNLENVNEALSRSEQFIENNQNRLLTALLVIIVIVAGVLIYKNNVVAPKEKEAQEMIFKGEYYFSIDSFDVALNGDNAEYVGFEAIKSDYKITKTSKLANAYAGLCYKAMGDYETAISYLSKVKMNDIMVSPALVGSIGDCYVELGENAKAAKYFEKAAAVHNELLAPIYLMKAGHVYEALGKYSEALKVYQTLKSEYPSSQEGLDVDKYIERAKLMK